MTRSVRQLQNPVPVGTSINVFAYFGHSHLFANANDQDMWCCWVPLHPTICSVLFATCPLLAFVQGVAYENRTSHESFVEQ